MLIDHKNLIQKTNLRQNLSEVIDRVYQGETIFISDRGRICAKIVPFDTILTHKKETKLIALQKELRDQLQNEEITKTDTTEFIRNERNKSFK